MAKWNKCTDCKPPDGATVLAFDGCDYFEATYKNGDFYFDGVVVFTGVEYWQSVTAPSKPKNDQFSREKIKRIREFFKGLSPREEYTKHAEFRKTIDEF